jgi:hypothetical protein
MMDQDHKDIPRVTFSDVRSLSSTWPQFYLNSRETEIKQNGIQFLLQFSPTNSCLQSMMR